TTFVAHDGTEAVALFASHKEKIAAVLTDMMMPLMDGAHLIRALQKMDPDVKIIASSGVMVNSRNIVDGDFNVKAFLSKPYTANSLLTTLRTVLS
ncbi:MAG: response regulator, partial [Bacteroidota bacterium]|nr:response regulator [Bacteroidota bacterium]